MRDFRVLNFAVLTQLNGTEVSLLAEKKRDIGAIFFSRETWLEFWFFRDCPSQDNFNVYVKAVLK